MTFMHSHHALSRSEGLPRATNRPSDGVITNQTFHAPPEQVWQGLLFYEQVQKDPPLMLRLLLPAPLGVEGCKSQVGDIARCRYDSGFLIKRVTRVDWNRRYEFEVLEQNLRVGGGIRLLGGCTTLRESPAGGTDVSLQTIYVGSRRPRRLWRVLEAVVCHAFHRHILAGMRGTLPPHLRLHPVSSDDHLIKTAHPRISIDFRGADPK